MMFENIELAIAEVQQPRSRFQLERFVLGQHATPEMQYYQTCLELQDMIHKFRIAQVEVKKLDLKISRHRSSEDELDWLEADLLDLGLQQTRLAMIGAEREIKHLIEIWHSFAHKFTRDEIEAAQPEYWAARLTGNANAMLMAGQGVNPAHIEAMAQAGVLDSFSAGVSERIENDVRNLET
jgi:hypothetical protein